MTKRSSTKFTTKLVDDEKQTLLDALKINHTLLTSVQEKLDSPVLNGGFDTLMLKVDNIEQSQVRSNSQIEHMTTKVDQVHEAVYHPDEGLFARVKKAELTRSDDVEKLDRDMLELKIWKDTSEKTNVKESETNEENNKLVNVRNAQLDELVKWKNRVCKTAKWVLVTLAGGSATLMFKLIYDILSGHVSWH
jgi:hypothetical protein